MHDAPDDEPSSPSGRGCNRKNIVQLLIKNKEKKEMAAASGPGALAAALAAREDKF